MVNHQLRNRNQSVKKEEKKRPATAKTFNHYQPKKAESNTKYKSQINKKAKLQAKKQEKYGKNQSLKSNTQNPQNQLETQKKNREKLNTRSYLRQVPSKQENFNKNNTLKNKFQKEKAKLTIQNVKSKYQNKIKERSQKKQVITQSRKKQQTPLKSQSSYLMRQQKITCQQCQILKFQYQKIKRQIIQIQSFQQIQISKKQHTWKYKQDKLLKIIKEKDDEITLLKQSLNQRDIDDKIRRKQQQQQQIEKNMKLIESRKRMEEQSLNQEIQRQMQLKKITREHEKQKIKIINQIKEIELTFPYAQNDIKLLIQQIQMLQNLAKQYDQQPVIEIINLQLNQKYQKVIKIIERQKESNIDQDLLAFCYSSIANRHIQQGFKLNDTIEKYINTALNMYNSQEAVYYEQKIALLNNLASYYQSNQQYSKAIAFFEQTLQNQQKYFQNSDQRTIITYNNLGCAYCEQGIHILRTGLSEEANNPQIKILIEQNIKFYDKSYRQARK